MTWSGVARDIREYTRVAVIVKLSLRQLFNRVLDQKAFARRVLTPRNVNVWRPQQREGVVGCIDVAYFVCGRRPAVKQSGQNVGLVVVACAHLPRLEHN